MAEEAKTVDDILEGCKGKMESCVVTGFDTNGNLFMSSSVNNVPFMHWTLNKSIFELGLFEKQANANKPPQTEEAPASDVDTEASDP